MKIVIADPIAPAGIQALKAAGFDVIELFASQELSLLECLQEAEALIVRSETQVTQELINQAPRLKVIGRAGVGIDNIDLNAATESGIVVMNTPTGNTIATAELTLSHILCNSRPFSQAVSSMKAGRWDRKNFSGSELFKKHLGILGLGRIGTEVAKRAQAFGMHVLAHDPFLTEERAKSLGITLSTFDELLEKSDYITVHMPLVDGTHHMIDEAAITKMKHGVRLFNCARGGILKESALIEGLQSGKIASAGLDVYEDEPLAEDHPLRQFENITLTPHLGASTQEAQESVGLEIADNICQLLKNGVIVSAINMPSVDARTLDFLHPYLTLGSRLGTLIQQIAADQAVEKLVLTYWGKITEQDTLPLTRAIQRGYLLNISGANNVNDVNAPTKLKHLGIETEVTQSSKDADYTELIQIQALCKEGEHLIAGTLFGKTHTPRVVKLGTRAIEVSPQGQLLLMENNDAPGMVGFMGSVLGDDQVNIANMSLSRDIQGGTALTVYEIDNPPSDNALEKIAQHPDISSVQLVTLEPTP